MTEAANAGSLAPGDGTTPTGDAGQAVLDPLRDGPALPLTNDVRELCTAARLREAPVLERAVRIGLAVLLVAYSLLTTWAWLNRPRDVAGNDAAFLRDAAAGRIVRVDDGSRPDGTNTRHVRWRNRNGAVYETRLNSIGSEERADPGASSLDVVATLRHQPYVRDHPDSVTLGPIEPSTLGEHDFVKALAPLALTLLLVAGPQPRRLTKWAWFWVIGTPPFGTAAFLVLGGSFRRGRPGTPSRRVNGWKALAGAFLVGVALNAPLGLVYDARHPVARTGAYELWVGKAG